MERRGVQPGYREKAVRHGDGARSWDSGLWVRVRRWRKGKWRLGWGWWRVGFSEALGSKTRDGGVMCSTPQSKLTWQRDRVSCVVDCGRVEMTVKGWKKSSFLIHFCPTVAEISRIGSLPCATSITCKAVSTATSGLRERLEKVSSIIYKLFLTVYLCFKPSIYIVGSSRVGHSMTCEASFHYYFHHKKCGRMWSHYISNYFKFFFFPLLNTKVVCYSNLLNIIFIVNIMSKDQDDMKVDPCISKPHFHIHSAFYSDEIFAML